VTAASRVDGADPARMAAMNRLIELLTRVIGAAQKKRRDLA
jgi:hypothetical protein